MIAARRLRIAWGGTPFYWKWKSSPDSRFKEVAKLRTVCWLEIRGRIETRMLSPWTTYKAYLVYKLGDHASGLRYPAAVTVAERPYSFDYESPGLAEMIQNVDHNVYLAPQRLIQGELQSMRFVPNLIGAKFPSEARGDGWLEIELGEFRRKGDEDDGELELICCEIEVQLSKSGLVVEGIEVRPVGE